MSQKKSELPQLPSLGELEARAEAELGKDPEGPEVEVHRRTINEIICPILERYMIEQGIKGTAKVHILPGNVVVCEKFMKNHSNASWFYSIAGATMGISLYYNFICDLHHLNTRKSLHAHLPYTSEVLYKRYSFKGQ